MKTVYFVSLSLLAQHKNVECKNIMKREERPQNKKENYYEHYAVFHFHQQIEMEINCCFLLIFVVVKLLFIVSGIIAIKVINLHVKQI